MKMISIEYVSGPNLQQSFYACTALTEAGLPRTDVEPVVVRATHVLPAPVTEAVDRILASQATLEEKKAQLAALPVQPEKYVEVFKASCQTTEDFKQVALHLAANKGQMVTAQTGQVGKEPTYATEPREKIKTGEEPAFAAEAGMTTDQGPSLESAPAVRGYFAGLPSKAVGEPQRAIDVNSSRVNAAQDPTLVAVAKDLEDWKLRALAAEEQLAEKKKDEESGEVVALMTDLGAVEDPKDQGKVKSLVSALDEKALGTVETLLKMVKDAKGKAPAGGPKPAVKPPAPMGAKPPAPKPMGGAPGGLPSMSSSANLVHASHGDQPALTPAAVGGQDPARWLQGMWLGDNARRTASANGGGLVFPGMR